MSQDLPRAISLPGVVLFMTLHSGLKLGVMGAFV